MSGMGGRVTPTAAALQRRMELALGALRAVTLVWATVVCAVDASSGVLDHPAPAFALLAVLATWSAIWTVAVGRRDRWIDGPGAAVDVAFAVLAVTADHVLYDGPHPQSFASAWPLIAVVATGVAVGPAIGLAAGAVVGLGNLVATAAFDGLEGEVLSTLGTFVLLAAAGWVAGWVASRLRTTAEQAAAAQARAEVARTLHDGVLQTLAVIQRRSTDDELVALAREQDAELRAFLRGDPSDGGPDRAAADDGSVADLLGPRLARLEARHGVTAHLVVIDPGTAAGSDAEALAAAVSEAVVNAAKHAGVDEVWVSVDRRSPSGSMVVVHDEGAGFTPSPSVEGAGIDGSMRGRLQAVGGGLRIDSTPGSGTDVTLWVP